MSANTRGWIGLGLMAWILFGFLAYAYYLLFTGNLWGALGMVLFVWIVLGKVPPSAIGWLVMFGYRVDTPVGN